MAETDWRNCGTVSEALFAAGDISGWSPLTASNLSADDSDYIALSLSSNEISYLLKCTNFGFSADIGPSDTIDGIELQVKGYSTPNRSTAILDTSAPVILIAGSPSGTAKPSAVEWDIGPHTETYPSSGASTDKWGTSITAAQVRASDFGVGLRVRRDGFNGITINFNFLQMKIYYTESGVDASHTMSTIDHKVSFSETPYLPLTVPLSTIGIGLLSNQTPSIPLGYALSIINISTSISIDKSNPLDVPLDIMSIIHSLSIGKEITVTVPIDTLFSQVDLSLEAAVPLQKQLNTMLLNQFILMTKSLPLDYQMNIMDLGVSFFIDPIASGGAATRVMSFMNIGHSFIVNKLLPITYVFNGMVISVSQNINKELPVSHQMNTMDIRSSRDGMSSLALSVPIDTLNIGVMINIVATAGGAAVLSIKRPKLVNRSNKSMILDRSNKPNFTER